MEGVAVNGLVHLPKTGANDVLGTIKRWAKEVGAKVAHGDLLAEIETSKAVVEIEAETDGWFYPLFAVDESVGVGTVIAVIADHANADLSALKALVGSVPQSISSPVAPTPSMALEENGTVSLRWTRKAELLAERHGLNRFAIVGAAHAEPGKVTEADVLAFLDSRGIGQGAALSHPAIRRPVVERVLVIGSAAGGGAAIVIDVLARMPNQLAMGVVDRDVSYHGRDILGVPVLGASDPDRISEMYRRNLFDAVVLAFNRNVGARAETFAELSRRGIPFTNVVDSTVNLRSAVRLGVGNVILGSSYIGTEAEIGDNNFLSSNTCIEHHCRLGSHNAFGPAVAFSGRVIIGDRIRFGTQIAVEPGISIGSDSIVASSCVITVDMPERSLLRAKTAFTVSPRADMEA